MIIMSENIFISDYGLVDFYIFVISKSDEFHITKNLFNDLITDDSIKSNTYHENF